MNCKITINKTTVSLISLGTQIRIVNPENDCCFAIQTAGDIYRVVLHSDSLITWEDRSLPSLLCAVAEEFDNHL